VEVHVSIAEATTSQGITTDTNRGDRTDLVKDLEDNTFSDITIEFTDVERGRGVRLGGRGASSGGRGWGSGRS